MDARKDEPRSFDHESQIININRNNNHVNVDKHRDIKPSKLNPQCLDRTEAPRQLDGMLDIENPDILDSMAKDIKVTKAKPGE